jgi:hypothetical protein
MAELFTEEVLPMFEMLDHMSKGSSSPVSIKGRSLRNLIGQAELREIQSTWLTQLLDMNNRKAMSERKPQYVFLWSGKGVPPGYVDAIRDIPNDKLTELQVRNRDLNYQLLELEHARTEEVTHDGNISEEPPF